MAANDLFKKNVTVEETKEILRKNGIEITEKEAAIILDFLYKMAILEVRKQHKR